jgi:hypothetical protein
MLFRETLDPDVLASLMVIATLGLDTSGVENHKSLR